MKKIITKYYKVAAYLIGIMFLLYLMDDYGFGVIIEKIGEVSWYFLYIVILGGLVYYLNTFSWKAIIDASGESISFSKIYGLVVSGYAINYITPFVGLGGEPYRIMALSKETSKTKATMLVSQYSLMHMYSHLWFWMLGLAIMVLNLEFHNFNIAIYIASLLFIVSMYIFFINLFKNGFIYRVYRIFSKLPIINHLTAKFTDKEDKIKNLDQLISGLYNTNKAAFYKSLFFEFASRLLAAVEYLLILKAIGVDISLIDAFYISAASSLIANIIFFIPMQIGVREGGLYFVLNTLGLNPGLGIIVGLVTRIREFTWIGIGFLIMPLINKKKKQELKHEY